MKDTKAKARLNSFYGCKAKNMEIDRAAETLEMLELLYNSIRYSDNVKNCILEDVRPSSARFVIREAIGVIERMKEGAEDEDRT